ncbi:hypothetical protein SYNPS1DRAFT_23713 [Syncephalis pseudoplumigaleata]|uniref:Btz domain-containing protein n=1 Tax=Syncephalis pseudoplumigaleata TaxID=1712513 RepID=A0A4P9YW07_9FUNG|nr:hypothetical protein SYNPS1DRAFT_23713 [Syncephalis pseudoplumigaleata]|eukprot:RKP24197.1 hypothetical protein SYNPS1DRAFT_23713 [Syncephalis pseudoplumigaleata]
MQIPTNEDGDTEEDEEDIEGTKDEEDEDEDEEEIGTSTTEEDEASEAASAEAAYEERQKVRNEYRQRLVDDPSFVPHIGSFWGHDDRFMPAGLRNRRMLVLVLLCVALDGVGHSADVAGAQLLGVAVGPPAKGRQIQFGNVVNVTLSGTPPATSQQKGTTKFSTHSLAADAKPEEASAVASEKDARDRREIATQTLDGIGTGAAAHVAMTHPPGPTAEAVANAGMAAAAANAVQTTKLAGKSAITAATAQHPQQHQQHQHPYHHHAAMTMVNAADIAGGAGAANAAVATSTANTTSPVVYLYTTPSGLTIPITEGGSYPMLAQHGPPPMHGHHLAHHPMSLPHHRPSAQAPVPLPQPILVQTANGLVVPVTPVSAGGAAGSGGNAATAGNPSAGGYYPR